MEKILISACLVGQPVRYDAGHCLIKDDLIATWQAEGRLVSICPEMAGGLPAPRPPCEIREGRVLDQVGEDWTKEFDAGAQQALKLVAEHQIKYALMKERSPSCGVNLIYDGTFTSRRIEGSGLTTRILKQAGVRVFSENELVRLKSVLSCTGRNP